MSKWISVLDELPELGADEYSENVLVTTKTKKGRTSITIAYRSVHGWDGSGSMSGVVAWQPLPGMFEEGEL